MHIKLYFHIPLPEFSIISTPCCPETYFTTEPHGALFAKINILYLSPNLCIIHIDSYCFNISFVAFAPDPWKMDMWLFGNRTPRSLARNYQQPSLLACHQLFTDSHAFVVKIVGMTIKSNYAQYSDRCLVICKLG